VNFIHGVITLFFSEVSRIILYIILLEHALSVQFYIYLQDLLSSCLSTGHRALPQKFSNGVFSSSFSRFCAAKSRYFSPSIWGFTQWLCESFFKILWFFLHLLYLFCLSSTEGDSNSRLPQILMSLFSASKNLTFKVKSYL
jgi:hypothetical protein